MGGDRIPPSPKPVRRKLPPLSDDRRGKRKEVIVTGKGEVFPAISPEVVESVKRMAVGRSLAEIAAESDINIATLRKSKSRAREARKVPNDLALLTSMFRSGEIDPDELVELQRAFEEAEALMDDSDED